MVKAVIRGIAPHAAVIDITHQVPPHDVRAGGLALARSVQYLPPGVVLAVVDPDVGTDRRAVAVEVGDGSSVLVGPDNGLLASAVAMCGGAGRVVSLTNVEYQLPAPGATFAGRDVMAPAAAHLCAGVDLDQLGEEFDAVGLIPAVVPLPRVEDGALSAEILWVDHYGNAQLNVGPEELAEEGGLGLGIEEVVRVTVGEQVRSARSVRAYADLQSGQLGLVVDSYGLLSLAFDRRSAAEELGIRAGDSVRLAAPSDEKGSP